MGLMDKVKAQATQITQKTQEAAREGKARLDHAQANKRADTLLRNLGALVYAERTNRGASDTEEKVSKLVGDLSKHEAENGINLSPHPAGSPAGGVPQQGGPTGMGPQGETGAPGGASSPPQA